jgi:hypothetical protein
MCGSVQLCETKASDICEGDSHPAHRPDRRRNIQSLTPGDPMDGIRRISDIVKRDPSIETQCGWAALC